MSSSTKHSKQIKVEIGSSAEPVNSATWISLKNSGIWNTASNWTTDVTPTGTALFSSSEKTSITFSSNSSVTVEHITFSTKAPTYTFAITQSDTAPTLTIAGTGITNHSQHTQYFFVSYASTSDTDSHL